MIILENSGEIDIDFIKTMGVNVKDCDSPIGYFGTGLKYAIAVFLRENIGLKLFIGNSEYEFFTEPKKIRGKQFSMCRMRGPMDSVDLGFTTELGKNWELWQAYREIHSNCLDENGEIYRRKQVSGKAGSTVFAIEDMDTTGIFLGDLNLPLLFSNSDIEIYQGGSSHIYYHGIRAKDLRQDSLYTYNIKRHCDLTEDRLLCYDFQIEYAINDAIAQMENKGIVKNVITARNSYESSLRMDSNTNKKPSDIFMKVFSESYKNCGSSVKDFVTANTPLSKLSADQRRQKIVREIENLCYGYDLDFVYDGGKIAITGDILRQQ